MKKYDARYSKMLLILLGVLAAIVIGFHSNAVGFDSERQAEDQKTVDQSAPMFDPSGKFQLKWLSLLK